MTGTDKIVRVIGWIDLSGRWVMATMGVLIVCAALVMNAVFLVGQGVAYLFGLAGEWLVDSLVKDSSCPTMLKRRN